MRKKNGFTLVELLVTIALMLTILGIAIVSFVNVSNNKKEEAWNNVKSQIETAALEYFNANEYLFEGLSNEVTGEISVGKLVQEDYLNQVTNPVTGLLVPNCAVVSVKKNNGRFSASFNEDSIDNTPATCDSSAEIVVSDVGAPSLDPNSSCERDGNNGWCRGNVEINLNIKTNNNGAIKNVSMTDLNDSEICKLDDEKEIINCDSDGVANVSVVVTNLSGKTAKWSGNVSIDTEAPSITNVGLRSREDDYNSNLVYGSFTVGDSLSGLDVVTSNVPRSDTGVKKWNKGGSTEPWVILGYSGIVSNELDGSSKTMTITATDKAGNESSGNSNNYVVYEECDQKEEKNFYTGSCNNNGYKMKRISKVDKYNNKIVCENGVPFKVDCAVESVVFALNYNAGDAGSNPGMKGVGPMASNGKGRIFKSNTRAEDYSTGKRGMNVSTGWNGTKLNGRSSSCNPWENADCTATDAGYAASSCKDVSDFQRRFRFKVRWTDGTVSNEQFINLDGTGPSYKTYFTGRNTDLRVMISEDLSEKIYRYGCSNGSNINVRTCGKSSGGTPNVTTHVYYLQAGGKTSNMVSLYTKYFVNCGY